MPGFGTDLKLLGWLSTNPYPWLFLRNYSDARVQGHRLSSRLLWKGEQQLVPGSPTSLPFTVLLTTSFNTSVADPDSGSWIRDELPGSYFQERGRNHFFGLKYFNSLRRIQNPGWKKFGIRDKHPGSATLINTVLFITGTRYRYLSFLYIF